MPSNLSYKPLNRNSFEPPLRAMLEIVDGKVSVLPVADSDEDERRIIDALCFVVKDWRQ